MASETVDIKKTSKRFSPGVKRIIGALLIGVAIVTTGLTLATKPAIIFNQEYRWLKISTTKKNVQRWHWSLQDRSALCNQDTRFTADNSSTNKQLSLPLYSATEGYAYCLELTTSRKKHYARYLVVSVSEKIKVVPIKNGLEVSASALVKVKQWAYRQTTQARGCQNILTDQGKLKTSTQQKLTIMFDQYPDLDWGVGANYGHHNWPGYCFMVTDNTGGEYYHQHMLDTAHTDWWPPEMQPDTDIYVNQAKLKLLVWPAVSQHSVKIKQWRWHNHKSDFACNSTTKFLPENKFYSRNGLNNTRLAPSGSNVSLDASSSHGAPTLKIQLDVDQIGDFYCFEATTINDDVYYRQYKVKSVRLITSWVRYDADGTNRLVIDTAMPFKSFRWASSRVSFDCSQKTPLTRLQYTDSDRFSWKMGLYGIQLANSDDGLTYCFRVVDHQNRIHWHQHPKAEIRFISTRGIRADTGQLILQAHGRVIGWRWSFSNLDHDCNSSVNFTNSSRQDPLVITPDNWPISDPDALGGHPWPNYCIELTSPGSTQPKHYLKVAYEQLDEGLYIAQVEGQAKLRIINRTDNLNRVDYLKSDTDINCNSRADFSAKAVNVFNANHQPQFPSTVDIDLSADDAGKFYCFRTVDAYDRVTYYKRRIKPTIIVKSYGVPVNRATFSSLGRVKSWRYTPLSGANQQNGCSAESFTNRTTISHPKQQSLTLKSPNRYPLGPQPAPVGDNTYCLEMVATDGYTQYLKYRFDSLRNIRVN